MSSDVAVLEGEVKEYKLQLETVLSSLQTDPDNVELQSLKSELEDVIRLTQNLIHESKPVRPPTPPQPVLPAPKEKWSKENHPAYQAGYRKPASPVDENTPSSNPVFKVNDMVLAKWVSGDKSFYPARITSITGSAAAPQYYVTFKSYGNTETLRGTDIRPVSNENRKRKADGSPITATTIPASAMPMSSSSVISAAANINPTLASQARKEPSKVSDGPPRLAKVPRKVKANKELEAGKNKWQDFTTKGKVGKTTKKDSMFRTPDGINARVGFTGSGQAMRKDPTRSRHIYQIENEEGM